MFLSKINKLIWIVFLLPCIQAQLNEFTFGISNVENIHINVTNAQEIRLICIPPREDIPVFLVTDGNKNNITVIIADRYSLVAEANTSRFDYVVNNTDPSVSINVLTINYIATYAVEIYHCISGYNISSFILNIFYPPAQPVCTTIQNNNSIALLCESEIGKPAIDMTISDSTNTYVPTLKVSNRTHTLQRVDLAGHNEDIICSTTHKFIQNDMYYTTNKSCIFKGTSIDSTTVTELDSTTVTVDSTTVTSPSKTTVTILPTSKSAIHTITSLPRSAVTSPSTGLDMLAHVNSSTIPKYSIFTLIMIILGKLI